MPVYFIASINVTDESDLESYGGYIERVKPIVESYGGRYIVRSEKIHYVGGEWRPDRVIVIEFPSAERVGDCFLSPEYRAIESSRSESVISSGIIVSS